MLWLMKLHLLTLILLAWPVLGGAASAQSPVAGRNTLLIRGQAQTIYLYPASGAATAARGKVLYLPGDIGLFGLGATIAKTIASWGYDVYGLDTRAYLSSFTGKTPLQQPEVMADFREIANWMSPRGGEKIALVGWSEGAGLCLLAAGSQENQRRFSGLITLGLTEFPTLAWHWSDLLDTMISRIPNEPHFSSADYMPRISPAPFLMIQSAGDQYVSVPIAQKLFSLAQEPKRFRLIEARDHRFEGNQPALFQTIREGLEWFQKSPPQSR
jgi:pimeloyl-ACP methyl ester carboxylesterase